MAAVAAEIGAQTHETKSTARRLASELLRGREDPPFPDVLEVAADVIIQRILWRAPQRQRGFFYLRARRPRGQRPAQFRIAQNEIDGLVLSAERGAPFSWVSSSWRSIT